jgi:hypothetical protein
MIRAIDIVMEDMKSFFPWLQRTQFLLVFQFNINNMYFTWIILWKLNTCDIGIAITRMLHLKITITNQKPHNTYKVMSLIIVVNNLFHACLKKSTIFFSYSMDLYNVAFKAWKTWSFKSTYFGTFEMMFFFLIFQNMAPCTQVHGHIFVLPHITWCSHTNMYQKHS